jgi:hypothetical protein
MSVETPEAPAAAETPEAPNDFQATLNAAMELADAPPVEEVEESAEGEEVEQPEEQPVEPEAVIEPPKEGPKPIVAPVSAEWLSEAIRLNVPRQVLKFARSDEEVREMIVEFGDQPEPEAESVAEFPIAADDFDATDPTHKALKAMWEQNQQLRGELSKVTQSTTGLITERQREAILAEEAEFDAALDALDIPELGERGSPARKAAWAPYKFFQQQGQGVSKAELAKRAAFAGNPDLIAKHATQKQLEAITGQQHRTLGAGPAKPPAIKPPTPKDTFLATLDDAFKKEAKRMQEAG